MIEKILAHPNGGDDGWIEFTKEEAEKYSLRIGKTVKITYLSKTSVGKRAQIKITVLD